MRKTAPDTPIERNGCPEEADPACRVVDCLPCDIPPLCRNSYYTGKLLTQRDLEDEQRFHRDKLRLHNLRLHGWGTVCGLTVEPHPHCPDLRLVLRRGFAIDGCGREIYVPRDVEIELPRPEEPPPPSDEPCPPYEDPGQRPPPEEENDPGGESRREEQPGDPDERRQEDGDPEPGYGEDDPKGYEPDDPEQRPTGDRTEEGEDESECPPRKRPDTSLYIWICYEECETEFQPAPFDECACDDSTKRPNRVCEGYRVDYEVGFSPPDWWEACAEHGYDDCHEILDRVLSPCPPPGEPRCIPLAVVCDYEPGVAVAEEMVDNEGDRSRLPSTTLLYETLKCLLEKLPTKHVTRIEDVNWTHEGERTWREFYHSFIGRDDEPRGFEITFSHPVRVEGLSEFTFRAYAVRHEDDGGGGYVEAVPAEVDHSSDRRRFYLRPAPDWAEECLRGISFDICLTLHCDLIVDDRGCPVDGELQGKIESDGGYAIDFPTGDGLPGGRFVSWIRVLPDSRRKTS